MLTNRPPAFRADHELPPSAVLITSPYDVQARYSRKQSTAWTGYTGHFTESCAGGAPQLIVEVPPTSATAADGDIVGALHERRAEHQVRTA